MDGMKLRYTYSVCPVCLRPLSAWLESRPNGIYLTKRCPEHGNFSTIVWRNKVDFQKWIGDIKPIGEDEAVHCPEHCGICEEHKSGTCCVLYEVTERCNLNCNFCFADPHGTDDQLKTEQIKKDIDLIAQRDKPTLQLSGGEPTLRNDLPQIVSYAFKAGCSYVQLNSNGIRLAEDESYVQSLAEAGLSFVFMQFDSTDDSINKQLRGRALLDKKMKAIENCAKYNIGVTLVPTLVPSVNIGEIGNILRLAISLSPAVRGVHFQPVSYFGRYPSAPMDEDRYTLDELICDLVTQAQGLVSMENLAPSRCDHPLCGFHGSFVVLPNRTLQAQTGTSNQSCCCKTTAKQNREFIGTRWKRREKTCCTKEMDSFDEFLERIQTNAFTITAMAFQDCYNLNIERLQHCSLHVYNQGKFVPFCANYLTGI